MQRRVEDAGRLELDLNTRVSEANGIEEEIAEALRARWGRCISLPNTNTNTNSMTSQRRCGHVGGGAYPSLQLDLTLPPTLLE